MTDRLRNSDGRRKAVGREIKPQSSRECSAEQCEEWCCAMSGMQNHALSSQRQRYGPYPMDEADECEWQTADGRRATTRRRVMALTLTV